MIISITGHRPNGLPKEYGYNLNNEAWTKVSEGGFATYKMMVRNRYMVNKSDIVIAVICKETGGTAQCVKYAKEHNKVVIEINPQNI